jgi:epoxyqueuosine reductase QueG
MGSVQAQDLNANRVKQMARELGADLVGIASAETLNAFPPDPLCPQTPDRILPSCRSVVVIAQRIPAGAFRCRNNALVQYLDMLVLRKMDYAAFHLAEMLEDAGFPSLILASQETDWGMKNASYGRLSTRHLGVEAGLGTLGLEVNILSPEFGPRLYLTGVLTELELEPDARITEQVCIGESCSRCLQSCPGDAVGHFDIDKRQCAKHAQEFGFATALKLFTAMVMARTQPDATQKLTDAIRSREFFGFWQGLLRVVGSFGDCPRCLEVCPVGNDYHAFLAEHHRVIPERTPAKDAKVKSFKAARKEGGSATGLNDWNVRWVGPEGYQGMVAKQLQAFKKTQQQKRDEAKKDSEH